ncbi:MAG: DUF3990 domain-containing protein [Defluviitaleaceae bacterium]|nr:DUF3990 domain-containing protein [Defluviitaleaceae bacterium]
MSKLLYHGGDTTLTLDKIKLPGLRCDCDFGQGFYLAEQKDTAEEWIRKRKSPVISVYEYDDDKSEQVQLQGVDWLKVVLGFRERMFNITFSKNVVVGAIANDDMTVSIPAFMIGGIGGIGDTRLIKSLEYCKSGNQYVFKNNLNGLRLVDSYELKGSNLDSAILRHKERRVSMHKDLLHLRKSAFEGEKFIEDYREDG